MKKCLDSSSIKFELFVLDLKKYNPLCLCVCIYIYIEREGEREIQRERELFSDIGLKYSVYRVHQNRFFPYVKKEADPSSET